MREEVGEDEGAVSQEVLSLVGEACLNMVIP
jgi:hypothetical protein